MDVLATTPSWVVSAQHFKTSLVGQVEKNLSMTSDTIKPMNYFFQAYLDVPFNDDSIYHFHYFKIQFIFNISQAICFIFLPFKYTEKNICQKLANYLETHDKFWNYVLFSNNSKFIRISFIKYAKLLIKIPI